jgi:hypothetical protein
MLVCCQSHLPLLLHERTSSILSSWSLLCLSLQLGIFARGLAVCGAFHTSAHRDYTPASLELACERALDNDDDAFVPGTGACLYVCLFLYVFVCAYVCMYVCMPACDKTPCIFLCLYTSPLELGKALLYANRGPNLGLRIEDLGFEAMQAFRPVSYQTRNRRP